MITLRKYQTEDLRRILQSLAGDAKTLFTLPTGGGKTAIASHVIAQYQHAGKRVLVLVHRSELLNQMHASLVKAMGIDAGRVGIIMRADSRTNPDAEIQVATVQTLVRRSKPKADLVVIDEAHHATKYGRVLSWYREAKWLGLTATAYRFDKEPLSTVFDTLLVGKPASWLIDEGWLLRPRVFAPIGEGPDLKGVSSNGRDFNLKQLAVRMNKRELVGEIVPHWLRLAKGRRTVCYAVTVEHGRRIVAAFRKENVAAELLHAGTSDKDRREMVGEGGRLLRGKTHVVVNCEVLTEGWDAPPVKCIIMARPTKSRGLFLQMSGRIFRPWPKYPRVDPIILDHAGNVLRHGCPHWDPEHEPTLDDVGFVRGSGQSMVKQCGNGECGAMCPLGAATCQECGWTFPIVEREPGETNGRLVEVEPLNPEEREAQIAKVISLIKRTETQTRSMPPSRRFAEQVVDMGWRE